MYAPHYAVALAASTSARRAPVSALLVGAFLPDLAWIALARAGVEPADQLRFFDDWSHSFGSVLVMATIFALLFWKRGRSAVIAIWLVVFSHFVLDFPVHPKRIAAYPLAHLHLGSDRWIAWGSGHGWFGLDNDWWLQLLVLCGFLAIYVWKSRGWLSGKLVAASCIALLGLQFLMLAPCVGY